MNKVALIAVAKDEDTYIHEWIHHHLFLGFSPIYIGVNRTSDKTLEVINKISETENDVHAFNIDWIDKGTIGPNIHIQNLGYSYLSTKIDSTSVEYVGYLDIDEFWFNVDGKKIQDFIHENIAFDIASFYWLSQLGEEMNFSPPFKNVFYNNDMHVKSIISSRLIDKVEIFTLHVPSFKTDLYKDLIHIDQEGNNISCLNPQKKYNSQKLLTNNKNVSNCILHRMIRSESEYLSLVLRGRPNGELVKSNGRNGFKKGIQKLPEIFNDSYYDSLECFINTNNLSDFLIERRIAKLQFFNDKIKKMNADQLIAESENAKIALSGTIGLNKYVNEFADKVNDVDALRNFAMSLESIDLSLSSLLMQEAYKLKPKGLIKKSNT